MLVPELNGTTEEKGEYGNASSTVRTFACLRLEPFIGDAPFDPLTAPCWMAYPLWSMLDVGGG